MATMRYFQDLGRKLELAWLHVNYDEKVFPHLSLEHLEKTECFKSIEASEIVDWLFSHEHAFQQPAAIHFGQPSITLFQAPRFFIEALFWFSATTSIHEHGFSGAFSVLAGSSLHSHWRFKHDHTINSRMLCGQLDRLSTEILKPGETRAILPGNQLIHQLFHLEEPSVTIVARTYCNSNHLPQYRYLLPGLAIDPESQDPLRARRLMLLDAMARGNMAEFEKYCHQMILKGEMETAYHLFSLLSQRRLEQGVLEDLYSLARARHGDRIDFFRQVCAWERRTRIVKSLRARVSDPDARFVLAALMLLPDKNALFDTLLLAFPGSEPWNAVESCLEKLSNKGVLGFELSDVNRLLLRGIVEGLDLEGLQERVGPGLEPDSTLAPPGELANQVKALARSDLLFPLFSESPIREEAWAA